MNSVVLDIDELKEALRRALRGVYAETPGILRANERAIVARIALCLAAEIEPRFRGLHVDVEYGRVGEHRNPKRRKAGSRIYPDLIVHERQSSSRNVLAAEFKLPRRIRLANRNRPCREDQAKVAELVRIGPTAENTRPYLLGMCATLYDDRADVWWITRTGVSAVERLDSPADPTPVKQDR